jgi:hypothetical protein
MIATWNPDLPSASLFALLVLALLLTCVIDEVRSVRRKREAARQIVAEHNARKALEKLGR